MTDNHAAFVAQIALLVQKYAPQYDIRVCSPIIAQAILESGWGLSRLSKEYHNYFGLKCGSKWTGPSVNMTTSEEYTPGTHTVIKDNFRVYGSMEEGVKGYFEFIQLARYQNLRGITDPEEYLKTIKADGYATSSTYVENLMKLIRQHDLTKYDRKQNAQNPTENVQSATENAQKVQENAQKTAENAQKEKEGAMAKWKTVSAAIDALENIETAENGYLEKRDKNPKYLDDKTANAGSLNYTKYWRDINQWGLFSYGSGWAGGSAWYWCAAFQYWSFVKTFGREAAKKLLLHEPFISCATLGSKSKSAKRLFSVPQRGDVALFYKPSKKRFGHTGLVIKVDTAKKKFWTIEGNTGTGAGVISNGGGVVVGKSYSYDGTEHRFHRPDYAGVLGITEKQVATATPAVNTSAENIAAGQRWLNANYKSALKKYRGKTLTVTGAYDTPTRQACITVWKDLCNRKTGTALDPANDAFGPKCKEAARRCRVSANSAGTMTFIVQLILSAKGYYRGAMDAA